MILREPCLPAGWYPRKKAEIEGFLKPFPQKGAASAVMAPHAGWYYSGSCAALAVSSLDQESGTVAVIGGHLPKGPRGGPDTPVLIAGEDGVRTPLGIMEIDGELREEFAGRLSKGPAGRIPSSPDRYDDNTVEVLLPMAHYYFPNARLLWLRFPADISSFDAGKLLYESAAALGRRLAVIASVDLTHYGANYRFNPKGSGKAALDWVKNVNDAAFINAVVEGNPALVLKRAEEDRSSCSAGAVLGALGFSASRGKQARLLNYSTSADARPQDEVPDSFVGYAAVVWE